MSIGSRLTKERDRLGLTIPELAEIAGVKKNTVISWQKDVSSPPAAKLAALGEAGVDLLYVLKGVREVRRHNKVVEHIVESACECCGYLKPTETPKRKYTPVPMQTLRKPGEVLASFIQNGISVHGWAREHDVSPHTVRDLLRGKNRGLRGKSHEAAIALGIKANPKDVQP
jgi:gp16 family phage-associated protein